jgi:bifunctional DNA-binding transcriptional regulator/antitoxin component of YhaV-PrlF toxin-antitoxin module
MEETPATRTRVAKTQKAATTKAVRKTTKSLLNVTRTARTGKFGKLKPVTAKTVVLPAQVVSSKERKARDVRAFHGYISLQSRGTVALPPVLRKRYGLDRPGSQVEITEREDGVLELRPTIAVPASQAWFWTPQWQEGERRADEDIAAGRTTTYDNVDDFMGSLKVDDE